MTLPGLFAKTVRNFGQRPALALIGQPPITYTELNKKIEKVTRLLEELGIEPGDKVAILSASSPNWAISYYGITFMGAIAVPILPDFHEGEIENILIHSETKAIFYSTDLQSKIGVSLDNILPNRIRIDDFRVTGFSGDTFTDIGRKDAVKQHVVKENDLAVIIYTSGTTGKSKGVMLSHKNICFTAMKGSKIIPIYETDRFLSVLPLSHSYENTVGLILPMINGACVYYLRGLPTPSILLPALQEVKPTFMLTVPMIIEKIYRNKIQPAFTNKWIFRMMYRIPPVRKKLNQVAGKKLMETFGGELRFFGIGGAKLSAAIEKFLIEARFPYAIGYGLTETSPLLAGCSPSNTRLQSTGPALEEVTLKIHDPDPITGEGEIWAKGANVMLGYYKEPELTAEIITRDGWLKTGDLGIFDKDGYLYIQGRKKNTILGSGGENVYPEEIESVINNFKYVVESLVIEQKGKLVALVHFNKAEIEEKYLHMKQEVTSYVEHKIDELMVELKVHINSKVNKFSKVQSVINQPEPFQKTPTQKIKRFLYNNKI